MKKVIKEKLHELHNDLLFLPEKKKTEKLENMEAKLFHYIQLYSVIFKYIQTNILNYMLYT